MDAFVDNVVAGSSRHKDQVVTELGADYVRKRFITVHVILNDE